MGNIPKIGLDAGHGLKTAGKQTPDGIKEWELNNKVRDKVVDILQDYEVEIIHADNKEGNVDEGLSTRRNMYVNQDVKAFVSIHHNAFTSNWNNATGVEVYTDKNPTTADQRLADCVYGRLVQYTGLKGRGIKQSNFTVINQNKIPAILVEGGFMDSTNDHKIITSDEGQNAYAKAVAEGLVEFLGLQKKTTVSTTTQQATKSLDAWANEVRAGKYGSGHANRETNLKNAGCPYDYQTVRNKVNELCGVKTSTSTSTAKPVVTTPTKTLDDWVNEVKAGKHGSGHANREASLKKAGCPYSYEEVRAKVNASYGVKTTASTPTPVAKPVTPTKSLDEWAREVMSGKHGSGHTNREASLKRSGCTYAYEQVRTRVNELSGVKTTPSTPQKSLDDWAREVKAGKHGNGHSNREKSLKKSGCQYTYSQVRVRVNALS